MSNTSIGTGTRWSSSLPTRRPLISLCMIVGNVEGYIQRCLESFYSIADEIVIVRAIGSAEPDRTVEICKSMGPALEIRVTIGEYKNAPGHEDWPHIDNFAAARQMSYDLATGQYCFWCDSDDILESGAEVVRELAERGGYAAYVFPYKIFARGVTVPRERMMLKEAGRWKFAVHECFDFHIKPVEGVEDERVVVTHMPDLLKMGGGRLGKADGSASRPYQEGKEGGRLGDPSLPTSSNDRNLRILQSIPEEEMSCGLWYHLHSELALRGDVMGAIETAKKTLACADLGRPEKYELFLNMARLSGPDLNLSTAYLHQAYISDPCRREALGLLTSNAIAMGQPRDALAYARQMMATLKPEHKAWNEREGAYGWLGSDIYAQALRANGLFKEAELVRRAELEKVGGPRIALVHATRGRPQQAAKARKMWLDFAERPDQVEHIFVIDGDDKESAVLQQMHHTVVAPGGGCVAAWNHGAFCTEAPVLIQMSDDWTPPPNWDRLILERFGEDVNKSKVLAISDGLRKDDLLCMAILTRGYWMEDYFMFHPSFTGVYSDNWFTTLAYRRGAVIEARDLVFRHDHFLATGAEPDRTYSEQNAPERYRQGEAAYAELTKGQDWSTVPGWFNYWPFYATVASRLKDGDTVAEVGVWMGRSIIFLAQALKRKGKRVRLLAIDTFAGEANQPEHEAIVAAHGGSLRRVFEDNITRCGVADMIEIVQGDSAEMASRVPDGSLAFCYVDAAHDYESVKKDLAAWEPKVKKDGLFAGHDAQHEPVMRAVRERFTPAIAGPCWVRLEAQKGQRG